MYPSIGVRQVWRYLSFHADPSEYVTAIRSIELAADSPGTQKSAETSFAEVLENETSRVRAASEGMLSAAIGVNVARVLGSRPWTVTVALVICLAFGLTNVK